MRKLITSLTLVVNFCWFPIAASADPVRVTGGQFTIDHGGDQLGFIGAAFLLHHRGIDANIGLWVPKIWETTCFAPGTQERCAPGELIDVSFRTPGEAALGTGDAVISGTTYSDVAFRGSLDFRVDPLTTPAISDFFLVDAPFTFNGTIRGFSGADEVFAVSLFGAGSTIVPMFRAGDVFTGEEGRVDYFFADAAPVPEPSTLLLFGFGAVAMVRFRKRMR